MTLPIEPSEGRPRGWTSTDKVLAALSWWITPVGLVGLFVRGLHSVARRHCLAALVYPLALSGGMGCTLCGAWLVLQQAVRDRQAVDAAGWALIMGVPGLFSLPGIAISALNTVAALQARPPFFLEALAPRPETGGGLR